MLAYRTSPAAPPPSSPTPSRRGGNRLPVGHPARGAPPAPYRRIRQFPLDPERRDRHQRERTRRAANAAVAAGELTREDRAGLEVLLEHTDATATVPIFPRLATIAQEARGAQHYAEPTAGARTAHRWIARLVTLGWVHKVHRTKPQPDGSVVATSNAYRVDIPDRWRTERQALEDGARSRSTKGRPTSKAPQNRRGGSHPNSPPVGPVQPPRFVPDATPRDPQVNADGAAQARLALRGALRPAPPP